MRSSARSRRSRAACSATGSASSFTRAWGSWLLGVLGLTDAFPPAACYLREFGAEIILIKGATSIPFKLLTITAGFIHMNFWTFLWASLASRAFSFMLVRNPVPAVRGADQGVHRQISDLGHRRVPRSRWSRVSSQSARCRATARPRKPTSAAARRWRASGSIGSRATKGWKTPLFLVTPGLDPGSTTSGAPPDPGSSPG